MAATLDGDVTILPPNTALQRKVGGSAGKLLSPDKVRRAEKELALVSADTVRPNVIERLNRIQELASKRNGDAFDQIWTHAHEIRGMAGTADMKGLGKAANLLCRYLDDSPAGFMPDANVVTSLVVTGLQAVREGADEDSLMEILLKDCAKAVEVQRKREGRSRTD